MSQIDIKKEVVVGYHGECLDGTVAAFSAFARLGDAAEYRQLLHRNDPPSDLQDKDVVLLDFAYPNKILDEFDARSIQILDHHDSLIDELKDRPGVVLDLERSGAGLSWDHFHCSDNRPRLVDYVEDDDLGRWYLPWSKEVRCYLGIKHAETAPNDFDAWIDVMEQMESGPGFKDITERGRDMVYLKIAEVKRTIQQTAQFIKFNGEIIPAVNSVNCVDEICEQYGPKYPFVIVWHGIPGGRYKYSLRTCREDIHVGDIAKAMGGGGRQRAAAFFSENAILQLPGVAKQ